jgi:hypothetical protein
MVYIWQQNIYNQVVYSFNWLKLEITIMSVNAIYHEVNEWIKIFIIWVIVDDYILFLENMLIFW